MFVWLTMALANAIQIVYRFLSPRISQAIDGDVRGFVPAGSVSSSSTLQVFRDATCDGFCIASQSICSVISFHSGRSRAVHPQILTHSSLGFPFHFTFCSKLSEFMKMIPCVVWLTSWGNPAEGMGKAGGYIIIYIGWDRIGRFSEAGLLEWIRFVIFCTRSCEKLQRTSGPISE